MSTLEKLQEGISKMDSLTVLAEYSQPLSITFILICFFFMVIFIVRLNADHIQNRVTITPGELVPVQAMVGVFNPFTMNIKNETTSSLKGTTMVEVTSQVSCTAKFFWAINIKTFYSVMHQPWHMIQKEFHKDSLFKTNYEIKRSNIKSGENVMIELNPPENLALGDPPRDCYPLVAILVAENTEQPEEDLQIVTMFSAFHLQDEMCSGKSHMISQHIRSKNGKPCYLKQLFMAPGEDVYTEDIQPEKEIEQDSICIVCQSSKVNRVVLPCRHTCTCDSCFIRLDKCPMCRCQIESYFTLNPIHEEEQPQEINMEDACAPWWIRMNNRLNTWLGFA